MIENTLRRHGDAAHGGDIAGAAAEWRAHGFDAEGVEAWLRTGCFDPTSADRLRATGVSAARFAARIGGLRVTVGYAFANGDLGIDGALAAAAEAV